MGLAEKLKKNGIDKTELSIRVDEKTPGMLEFYLKAAELEDNGDKKYVYGPVAESKNPGNTEHEYINLLKSVVSSEDAEKIRIAEEDAERVIKAVRRRIAEYESAGIVVLNRDAFFPD